MKGLLSFVYVWRMLSRCKKSGGSTPLLQQGGAINLFPVFTDTR